ncbi:hypothetical protein D9613_008111 [Agrocybe pediades]|uniref:Uncharacterized protein n=1 Tax=Agrocybe pediades TaxID=84607 RepID=A0A8H4VN22_9AGAR|nr:hypothetical protein D9613_008111 [Agrocybe pediades]
MLESLQILRRDSLEALALLKCITPSSRCGLVLAHELRHARSYRDPVHVWPPPSTTYDVILKWVFAYLNGHPPNFIKLDTVCVGDRSNDLVRLAISDCNFKVPVYYIPVEQRALYVEAFLDPSGLSFVQELATSSNLFCAVERLHLDNEVVPSDLYPVYHTFSSVSELTLGYQPSGWYKCGDGTTVQPCHAALFPRLHTLMLEGIFFGDHLEQVVEYLEYRWEIGWRVSILNLSQLLYDPGCVGMRDRLGKLDGLVVIYKTAD